MVALLLAAILAAEVTQDEIDTYAEISRAERAKGIASIAAEIERLKRRSRRDVLAEYRATKWEFPEKKPSAAEYVKQEAVNRDISIQGLQQLLDKLEDPEQTYFASRQPEAIGDIGRFTERVRVVQIADDDSAIVRPQDGELYWLDGVATTKWRDGQAISLRGLFYVSGNKTYETVGGLNTIYLLEPVDLSKHADKFRAK